MASHAQTNGIPVELVHRVIMRESRYNPHVVHRGNYGMMQIRLGTARAMGYSGSAAGLLDPNTNMTYAVKYLAGAYRAAGGNADRAVALYTSGYGGRGRSVPTYAQTVSPVMGPSPMMQPGPVVQAGPVMGPRPALSRETRRARGEYVAPRRRSYVAQVSPLREFGID